MTHPTCYKLWYFNHMHRREKSNVQIFFSKILRVSNISQNKVVFKVKTTQPTWYYVRPNQHVLDIGQTEEVVIVLIQSECS